MISVPRFDVRQVSKDSRHHRPIEVSARADLAQWRFKFRHSSRVSANYDADESTVKANGPLKMQS